MGYRKQQKDKRAIVANRKIDDQTKCPTEACSCTKEQNVRLLLEAFSPANIEQYSNIGSTKKHKGHHLIRKEEEMIKFRNKPLAETEIQESNLTKMRAYNCITQHEIAKPEQPETEKTPSPTNVLNT